MGRILFILLIGLAGTGILLSLGVWQVQRLAWKQELLADIDRRIDAVPVPLPEAPTPDVDRYMPVEVSGRISDGELHVLVSVKRVGPGYRIISPFETDTGRRIMIDRGFVPTEAKAAARQGGAATIAGHLHWPREIDSYTPAPDVEGNTWFARDVPAMAAALNTEEILVIAQSQTDPNVTPLPVDTSGIPNDHLQYAITWFSLAAIWVAMTVFFLWRTRARHES